MLSAINLIQKGQKMRTSKDAVFCIGWSALQTPRWLPELVQSNAMIKLLCHKKMHLMVHKFYLQPNYDINILKRKTLTFCQWNQGKMDLPSRISMEWWVRSHVQVPWMRELFTNQRKKKKNLKHRFFEFPSAQWVILFISI